MAEDIETDGASPIVLLNNSRGFKQLQFGWKDHGREDWDEAVMTYPLCKVPPGFDCNMRRN
jgi:hypothetical protein